MCIAIYLPEFKEIDKKTLEICNEANPDGMGFAFFNDKNKMVLNKTVDPKKINKMINILISVRKYFIYRPFLIHFRIATHGQVIQECCHPFRVNNDTVFCHNGILHYEYGVNKTSLKSDTMMFNEKILRKLKKTELDSMMEGKNEVLKELLEGYIGDRNKMILLNSKDQVQILNEKAGIWDKGIWYSNSSYKKREVVTYNYSFWQGAYWDNTLQEWMCWDKKTQTYKAYNYTKGSFK